MDMEYNSNHHYSPKEDIYICYVNTNQEMDM